MVYSVSYKEKEKRVSWLFERGIGYRRYCKEDNQEASFKELQHAVTFSDVSEPYNPVGRNKLLKKSKRGQKNTRATYYYQSDSIKRELFIRKRNSYVKCNEGKRKKEPH